MMKAALSGGFRRFGEAVLQWTGYQRRAFAGSSLRRWHSDRSYRDTRRASHRAGHQILKCMDRARADILWGYLLVSSSPIHKPAFFRCMR